MALGDTFNNNSGNNNSSKEEFSATVRSGYGFTNPDSKVIRQQSTSVSGKDC